MANPNPSDFFQNDQLYDAARQLVYVSEEDEDDEEDEEEEEDEDDDYVADDESLRVTRSGEAAAVGEAALENEVEEAGKKRRRIESGEVLSLSGVGTVPGSGSQGSECKWGEIDGLFCPICMEAWTNDGDHHIWCKFMRFYF